jgi:hypothetical protein
MCVPAEFNQEGNKKAPLDNGAFFIGFLIAYPSI